MNFLRRASHNISAVAITPLYWVEKKERERKLEERLKRLERRKATLAKT